MNPVILAGPAVEPVSLADMKAHLRLETDDENALVADLTASARVLVERRTRLLLISQSWRLTLDRWGETRRVPLPFGPVLAVTAVRVRPASGPPAALDPALYRLDGSRDPTRLVVDATAPEPGVAAAGLEIDATCGFGTDPASVPAPLRLAIRRLAAFWFERRGDGREAAMPPDVDALLAPYRRPRFA